VVSFSRVFPPETYVHLSSCNMPHLNLILPLKFFHQNFARVFHFSYIGHMYGPPRFCKYCLTLKCVYVCVCVRACVHWGRTTFWVLAYTMMIFHLFFFFFCRLLRCPSRSHRAVHPWRERQKGEWPMTTIWTGCRAATLYWNRLSAPYVVMTYLI
jgi:hypothetical protein